LFRAHGLVTISIAAIMIGRGKVKPFYFPQIALASTENRSIVVCHFLLQIKGLAQINSVEEYIVMKRGKIQFSHL